jgi:4-hydroxyacetophenone monooxygenase
MNRDLLQTPMDRNNHLHALDFAHAVADETILRAALEEADVAPLAMVLAHLSGDDTVLEALRPYIHGAWNFMEDVPPELKQKVRDELVHVLKRYAANRQAPPPRPSDALLRKIMEVCVGQPVPDEYIPMLLEEMRLDQQDPRTVDWRQAPDASRLRNFHVLIIGAGMSGICMAIKLGQAGIPYTILEKNDTVGGTWYENSYPGCGVDTPNHFYSFSFAPNHDWPEHFSKRDELWTYLERCADTYDIRRHVRFETEVIAAQYDAVRQCWRVTLQPASGAPEELEANVLVSAVGQLNRPAMPDIPHLHDFQGPMFHTAQWNHDVPLAGKRVGMIGTGASAMQTGPSIASTVKHLTIFQRTPHWAAYNPNYHATVSEGKKWVLKHVPFYAKWYRFQLFWASADGIHASLHIDPEWPLAAQSLNAANQKIRANLIAHMQREIGDDPELLAKVTPPYPPYGKRMLRDNHWYRMLTRDNVELITTPIDHVCETGIVTQDGVTHEVDVLVLATGFQAGRMLWPMEIRGKAGQTLEDMWGEDDPRAYLGITVPGFPNLFILYGPNTNLGHGGSAIFHTECQVRYTMLGLREMIESDYASMECRQEPHDAYNVRVDEAHRKMVWAHSGVRNWYKNARGRVTTNSPWRLVDYWKMTSELHPEDYRFA